MPTNPLLLPAAVVGTCVGVGKRGAFTVGAVFEKLGTKGSCLPWLGVCGKAGPLLQLSSPVSPD